MDIKLSFLDKYKDAGLLFLRVGVGLDFLILHGWGKIVGGPETWLLVGQSMPGFGVDGVYIFWGFIAALTESLGSVLFALGLFYRPVSFLLGFTMLSAVVLHITNGDGWIMASHALKMIFVFWGMMLTGPGKYSLDKK